MKSLFKASAAALALAPFLFTPVMGQAYRWDASINGGGTVFTNVLNSDDDAFNAGSIKFSNSWITGGQLGYWFSRSFGIRANMSYSSSDFRQSDFDLFNDINLWGGTGDVLFRFVKPHKEWSGTEFLPYFAAGIGANWVNPPGNQWIMSDDGFLDEFPTDPFTIEGRSGVPIVCRLGVCQGPATPGFPGIGGIPVLGERTLFLREGASFAGLLGLGVDVRFAPSFAVRLEVGDRIWKTPFNEVATEENVFFVVRDIDHIGKTVNQFYGTLGLAVPFGLIHPPQHVAARPAPPAPPPPPPPPPPPTTENIMVCVVDPTAASGLTMLNAQRNLQTGDTTVIKNGVETPISAAISGVPVAGNADWFIRGEPLTIGSDKNKMLFLPVGSSRMIDAGELDFIGTVGGLTVFVDRGVKTGLLSQLGPNTDISTLVNQSKDVHDALDKVATVYVPMSGSGCMFQELAKQQAVRK